MSPYMHDNAVPVQRAAEYWRHRVSLTRPKSNKQMTDIRQKEIEPASTRTTQALPPILTDNEPSIPLSSHIISCE